MKFKILKDYKFKDGRPDPHLPSFVIIGNYKWTESKSEFKGQGKDKVRISNKPSELISADVQVPDE